MRISDWSSDVCSSDLFGLRRIKVVADAEQRQIGADHVHHRARRLALEELEPFGLRLADIPVAELGSQRLSNRLQIFAGIIAFGNLADVLAQRLAVTQMGGAGERIDLAARLGDVIFAGHAIGRAEEQTSELQSLM